MTDTTLRFRDDPWPRLPWLVPAALALTFASQVAFLSLLGRPGGPRPTPRPVDVQVIELPATLLAPARPAPAPPERRPTPPAKRATEAPRPTPAPPAADEPRIDAPTAPTPPVSETPTTPAPAGTVTAPPPAPAAPSAAVPAPSAPPSAAVPPRGTPEGRGGTDRMSARAIYQPMPEIPEALRRRTVDLVAVARFRVEASGSAHVELIEPTPDPELNRALLDSLRRWRFFPATRAGKPVASTIEIRIPVSVR